MEPGEPVDFQPETDTTCIFCNDSHTQLDYLEQENIPEEMSCIEQTTPSQKPYQQLPTSSCNGTAGVMGGAVAAAASMPAAPDMPSLDGKKTDCPYLSSGTLRVVLAVYNSIRVLLF